MNWPKNMTPPKKITSTKIMTPPKNVTPLLLLKNGDRQAKRAWGLIPLVSIKLRLLLLKLMSTSSTNKKGILIVKKSTITHLYLRYF